jgi:hypothetical protein
LSIALYSSPKKYSEKPCLHPGCKHGKSSFLSEIRLEKHGETWESVGKRLRRKMEVEERGWGSDMCGGVRNT